MTTEIVRGGTLTKLARDGHTGIRMHTLPRVYGIMMLTIAMEYAGCPDVRTMTLSEIRYFYNGIRRQLMAQTAPR